MTDFQNYIGVENSDEDFSTIHLGEVKKMLGYSGRGYRSVLVWCAQNHITVIGINRRQRILRSDWIRVNKEEITKTLKRDFPNQWQEVLKQKGIEEVENSTSYVPKSRLSENFLKDLYDE
jgi:hypothetical protein